MKTILIKRIVYRLVNKPLSLMGYKIINKNMHHLIDLEKFRVKTKIKTPEKFISFIFKKKKLSNSQLFQDLFVDFVLSKEKGIFCEVGAADGINFSNTLYLEKYKKWTGVLCEPSKYWRNSLKKNRKKSNLVFDAIDDEEGEKNFFENQHQLLSGFKRTNHEGYLVKITTLNNVLKKNKIKKLDYLSIDTEGNEYRIISKFDLKKFKPKVVTIEHNYSSNKKKINKLMLQNGYKLIFPFFSRFDSFYVYKTYSNKF